MGDFILDYMGWIIAAFVAVIAALLVVAVNHDMEQKAPFMAECMEVHKEFECTALWRDGEPEYLPVIIPMAIR